MSVTDMA